MSTTTCTMCGALYEAGSEEQANELVRLCVACRTKPPDDCPHGRWKGETCLDCLIEAAPKVLGGAMGQQRDDRVYYAASAIYARSLMAKPTALGSVEWVMMEPALAAKAARRLVDAVALELLEQGLKP